MNISNYQRRIDTIVFAALAAFTVNAIAGSGDFVDELRGLSFGAPQNGIPNLVKEGDELSGLFFGGSRNRFNQIPNRVKERASGGLQFFSRRGDDLHYRGVKLDGILYGFRNGKLELVELGLTSIRCDTALHQAIQARFGEPRYRDTSLDLHKPKDADCDLVDSALCEAYKYEGFPKDPHAKGIVAWDTRYIGIENNDHLCSDRVRFSRSSRSRAEHDKAEKDEQDLLRQVFEHTTKPGKQ